MKRLSTLSLFSVAFLLGFLKTTAQESALSSLCFTDGFGIVYTTSLNHTGAGVYTGSGTSTAYPSSSTVTLKLTLTSPSAGTLQMKVVNDAPDGCTSSSDYYTYTGAISLSHSGGHASGTGSGTWISYCSGSPINSGTWTAAGPCSSAKIKPGINPASGSQKIREDAAALSSLCFTDGFGIVYTTSLNHTGAGVYTGTGTSTAYPSSSTVTLKLTLTSPTTGTLQMKVVNDAPDGCTSSSDYYTYTGAISLSHSGGHPSGTGSGTWISYCSGSPINSGTWTAAGPCSSAKIKPGINPASGSQKIREDAAALSSLCFTDGFGIVYTTSLNHTGAGVYTGTGTSTAYPSSSTVTLKLTLTSPTTGTLQMKVVNDAPDGCTSSSDYYTYTGAISLSHSGGHPSGTGSGTWISYCSGSPINSGTWTAAGPCSSAKIKPGINPASGSQKIKESANALSSLCFTDGFGYVYTAALHPAGHGVYTGIGTSTAYSASTVTLKITLTSPSAGTLEMKVVNDAPDGCTSFSDGYTYSGTIAVSHSGGHPSGTGSGTWISYCSGSPINSGTWTASGPCTSAGVKPGINPASGSLAIKSAITIVPNPVINHTQLSYVLAAPGKVNIIIYNAMQQPVKVLVNELQAAGNHSVTWNTLNAAGSSVPSGIYKVVAIIGNKTSTSSLQVIR